MSTFVMTEVRVPSKISVIMPCLNAERHIRDAARRTVETRFSSRVFAAQFMDAAQAIVRLGPPPAERGAVAVVEGLLAQLGRAEKRLRGTEAPRPSLMQRSRNLLRKWVPSRTENQG